MLELVSMIWFERFDFRWGTDDAIDIQYLLVKCGENIPSIWIHGWDSGYKSWDDRIFTFKKSFLLLVYIFFELSQILVDDGEARM